MAADLGAIKANADAQAEQVRIGKINEALMFRDKAVQITAQVFSGNGRLVEYADFFRFADKVEEYIRGTDYPKE